MEKVILTSRLKLTLLDTLDEGSQDLEWAHQMRTDEQATCWSLPGVSKSVEDTKKLMSSYLPTDLKKHRAAYFIHKIIASVSSHQTQETELVGILNLKPELTFSLPAEFTVPNGPETGVLVLEVGYSFLPAGWGKGYATEALIAVLSSLKTANDFLSPCTKLYVQGVVGHDNLGSIRVMEKSGMQSLGTYEWEGEPVWLAGGWRGPRVLVYGQWVIN